MSQLCCNGVSIIQTPFGCSKPTRNTTTDLQDLIPTSKISFWPPRSNSYHLALIMTHSPFRPPHHVLTQILIDRVMHGIRKIKLTDRQSDMLLHIKWIKQSIYIEVSICQFQVTTALLWMTHCDSQLDRRRTLAVTLNAPIPRRRRRFTNVKDTHILKLAVRTYRHTLLYSLYRRALTCVTLG